MRKGRKESATVSLRPPEEGYNMWEAEQVEESSFRDIDEGCNEIAWSFGPVKINGSIDTSTYDIGVNIGITGINIDDIHGNLKDGVGLNVNLFSAKARRNCI
ncbi:uncharacterized protein B0J16DRAFT_319476 [Fusarium flagelliforme]|uniref:uncharacterized protein n=1 Tax=Fusarium flagelliforme TaxID=2675880 RepID=UPI001E8D95BB|nr:uncharacterized protein B0J16DRAFT_319476 [Fusarium flagelliforme]KAH7184677.1 hypothetical protein B0J16DRAFT_319476 [Fusarium flagelliforme]